MSKKWCELCSNPAQMLCESDQASLCWHCDEKVHAANFLVAKHIRTLLCHICHRPTPWTAAGPKLGPTVSVCQACAAAGNRESLVMTSSNYRREIEEDCDSRESGSDDEGENCSDSDDCSEEEEDDGENQVVPWSASPPLDTAAISSDGNRDANFLQSTRNSRILC